jgi:hypothetical protein
VSRVRYKFVAVLLVAFWLLATQHCGLEAAEIFEPHKSADQTCCPEGEAHCSHDGCEMVEDGGFRADSDAPGIPTPQFATCLNFICWDLSVPPLKVCEGDSSAERFERSLNWVPTWQFVRRAALSPRAPSLA